ncbi:fatty acid hydroxylase [Paenibacillus sp. 32O-W]|jgi:Sterol desaturase|uniref:sterol desaturase family protein n=1 Tax=Paenibacillus sp. 32O-W TaxID=1695218 RepID=UPI00071ED41B|nr:sterol desaturase family protein [Paenibacillus sp. 32O-W]ALS28743.1 fatty acid hydroxylase [Paenibacillus sp. 32O-W]
MSHYREFFSSNLIRFVAGSSLLGVTLTCLYFDGFVTILALALGALVYAVAEYVVHRYVLHEFPRLMPTLYRGHVEHHKHPQELKYLFSPVHYDVLIYAVYIPLVWLMFRQFSVVVAVVTGTLLFQLYYQWMHYAAHRPVVPRTAWGRWMKKKHLLHHFKDEYAWYGVSHPVLDYVMGTDKEQDRAARKAGTEAGSSSTVHDVK